MRVDPEVDEMVDQALAMVEGGDIVTGERILTDLFNKHPDIHTVQCDGYCLRYERQI